MIIRDKHFVNSRGLIVTGEADPDEFHVNDQVTIFDGETIVDTGIIAGTEKTYLSTNPLKISPTIGIILRDVDHHSIIPGMILSK